MINKEKLKILSTNISKAFKTRTSQSLIIEISILIVGAIATTLVAKKSKLDSIDCEVVECLII